MYNNNSYGNFICVFECTIVNSLRIGSLQMLLEIGLFKKIKKKGSLTRS